MAITPRSKGLGNIGAIVDRQGRASVAAPVKPTSVSKPKIAAPVKPAPKPAPKPVAKVAPKPAPKMAPSPFNKKPDTRAPGGGGMDMNGNPIGGMAGQFNIAAPNFARNTGPMNGAAPAPGDLYNRGGPQKIGGAFGRPIFGGPPTGGMDPRPGINPGEQPFLPDYGYDMPMTAPDFGNYDNLPPPPGMGGNPYEPMPQPGDGMYPNAPPPGYDFGNPGYGGPYTPRPDMGPGVGFGVGLPQPYDQFSGQQPMFGNPNPMGTFNPNATSDYDQLEGPGYNTGGFMGGGSGSMFGGGGFTGR